MRALSLICLLGLLTTSCSKPGVALQEAGELSAAERQSLIAIHFEFVESRPAQSAVWSRNGVVRRIYLRAGGISSLTMPYYAVVFDAGGRIIEANIIHAPHPSVAETVSSVSPLRVKFKGENGETFECGGEYSLATWRDELQKEIDFQKRGRETVRAWRRSGSTNVAELHRMIQNLTTNSPK